MRIRRLMPIHPTGGKPPTGDPKKTCLLYTSDAADERSSVDLGGRRIIKKKKDRVNRGHSIIIKKNRT